MKEHQVFSTMSPKRWQIVQSVGLSVIALILIAGCFFVYNIRHPYKPQIPQNYTQLDKNLEQIAQDTTLSWSAHAANSCCTHRQPIVLHPLSMGGQIPHGQQVRAAYYNNWDLQSYYSLKKNINKINMLLPEWMSLDEEEGLLCSIDTAAYNFIQEKKPQKLAILPVLKNQYHEGWDNARTEILLHDNTKQTQLIEKTIETLKRYGFQGIQLDFEGLNDNQINNYYAFLDNFYHRLNAEGFVLAHKFVPYIKSFDIKKIYEHSDYVMVDAMNQNYDADYPKGVAPLDWVQKWMDNIASQVPKDKLILNLPNYGTDFGKKGKEAQELSYRMALSIAEEGNIKIKFNPATYNLEFEYKDDENIAHKVFLTDAVTTFNQLRTIDHNGWRGAALHRLGLEDSRIWSFYNSDLSLNALNNGGFNVYDSLSTTIIPEDVEYIGEGGEIFDVVNDNPKNGSIRFEYDKDNHLIINEYYDQLPTSYVMEKFGKSPHKKLVLTFDDGPDKKYTPQVLDILKQENVPAVFFTIGKNVEANPEILKRIYDEGHEIGNHTYYHPDISNSWKWRGDWELVMTRSSIENITGSSTILFRPPYNPYTEPKTVDQLNSFLLAKRHNYLIVSESIDPLDWSSGISADTIFQRVNDKITKHNYGHIILLHDAGGETRDSTIKALPRIIQAMRDSGYQFVSLANLMGKTKAELMPSIADKVTIMAKMHHAVTEFIASVQDTFYWIFIATMVLGIFRFLFILFFAVRQYWQDKKTKLPEFTPPLSIMVPAYNEEVGAVSTIASLLNQNYPDFEIVFIDDGSKDSTYQVVKDAYEGHPKVRVLTKPNGGKASALNYGLKRCQNEFVVCIDADTILDPNALYNLVKPFSDPIVGAVAGNVKVGNQINLLTIWQSIEYITAQNFDRMAFANLNCITVVPGAIGAFRRQAIGSVGWYQTDTLAEDCDLTVRIIRKGYKVVQNNAAIAITEAPEAMQQFMKQRFRWSFGIMQAFWKSKHVLFNRHYGSLGFVAFPNILFFGLLFPLLAPIADITMVATVLTQLFKSSSQNIGQAGYQSPDNFELFKMIFLYISFILIDFGVSTVAFVIQKEPLWKLWALIPQRFVYRPLQYWVLFKAYKKALKGELMGWGVLKRTGSMGKVEVNQTPPNIQKAA